MRRGLWRLRGLFSLSPGACRLTGICLIVFFAQEILARTELAYGYSFGDAFTACFAMDTLFLKGFFWQPLTYMFLHATGWHIALNLFTVLFFGAGMEAAVGTRRFWRVFLLGGIVGGLGWLLVTFLLHEVPAITTLTHWIPASLRQAWHLGGAISADGAVCVGASGGVFALIGAYAALFPRREVYLLLFFVIPLRLRAGTLAIVIGLLTVAEAMFVQSQVAYAAHLAGGVCGYLLARRWRG